MTQLVVPTARLVLLESDGQAAEGWVRGARQGICFARTGDGGPHGAVQEAQGDLSLCLSRQLGTPALSSAPHTTHTHSPGLLPLEQPGPW